MILSCEITPEMREIAAQLCSAMASRHAFGDDPYPFDFLAPCEAIGADCYDGHGAAELARLAFQYTLDGQANLTSCGLWSNAEAMLRTGWTP